MFECLAACEKTRKGMLTKVMFAEVPEKMAVHCEKCALIFDNVDLKLGHMVSTHLYKKCEVCYGVYETDMDLFKHTLARHVNIKKCSCCQVEFESVVERVKHTRTMHKDRCPLCQKDVCEGYRRHVTVCADLMPKSFKAMFE